MWWIIGGLVVYTMLGNIDQSKLTDAYQQAQQQAATNRRWKFIKK